MLKTFYLENTMSEINEPEDLGVKIGTKEEKFWTDTKKKAEEEIEQCNHMIEIDKEIIKLAEKRIAEEQKV